MPVALRGLMRLSFALVLPVLSACETPLSTRVVPPQHGTIGEPLLPAPTPERALVIFARMPDCDGDLSHRTRMCERHDRIAVVEGAAVIADLAVGDYTAVEAQPGEHFYAASFRNDACTDTNCAAALVAHVEAGAVYLVTFAWQTLSSAEVGYRAVGHAGLRGRTSFAVGGNAEVLRYQKWMRTARRVEPAAGFMRGLSPTIVSLANRRLGEDAARGERTPWLDSTRAVAWDDPIPPIPMAPRHRAERDAVPDIPPFDAASARAALSDVDLSSCRLEADAPTWGHASIIINPDGQISKVVIDEPANLGPATVKCIGTTLGRATMAPFRGSLVTMGTTWHLPWSRNDRTAD